MKGEQDELGR